MMEEMDINHIPDRETDVDMEENMDESDDDEECLDDWSIDRLYSIVL